jgi:hypothetical protein
MGNKAEAFDAEKWALAKSLMWVVKLQSVKALFVWDYNLRLFRFYCQTQII